jgi:3-oxoacyl-[acyl-carrier-protein] synthase III
LYTSRFAAIGALAPLRRVSGDELMGSTKHRTHIELERPTGIREHHVVAEGEDSSTLALGAGRLGGLGCVAEDLDVLIVSCISRHVGGLRMQLKPPVSVSLKEELGAGRAMSFDLANATRRRRRGCGRWAFRTCGIRLARGCDRAGALSRQYEAMW